MKKLINAVDDVVNDALRGVELSTPSVQVDHENRVVVRRNKKSSDKVALISGGGSGHEPLHGGFVGEGMLDAAVAGHVFTSPTPDQVFAAAQAVGTEAGVLMIVKNYTGDIMNFEMAGELAEGEGLQVAQVVIADDVAVEDSTYTAGRRGVGLTVLAEKLLGAAAEEGKSLEELVKLAEHISAEGRSMGMALTSCTVPAAGKPTFELGEQDIAMGIGIHGEPGRTVEPLKSSKEIAQELVDAITGDHDYSGSGVIAMVNGMGGTPLIELQIVFADVYDALEAKGVKIERSLVGNYITSLDMAGCSLTLLKADDELLRLWDAPVVTAGLRWGK